MSDKTKIEFPVRLSVQMDEAGTIWLCDGERSLASVQPEDLELVECFNLLSEICRLAVREFPR